MRILFVTARPPWPPRRGDQARTAGWVRELLPRHEVRVLALVPPGFPPPVFPDGVGGETVPLGRAAMISGVLRERHLPGQVALHVTSRLRRAFVREVEGFQPDVVVPVLSRVGWVAEPNPGVPVVTDLVDSLALNFRNRARREPLLRPLLLLEARRIAAWERRLARCSAAATVVSERDRRAIVQGDPGLAAKVHVVPFGVDVPDAPPEPPQGNVVLLSGNLGYFPTVDGALWFADEVWPRILARRSDLEWWLAGARPARAIRRLAGRPGVRLVADPDDLAAVRRRAAVAVVPLRSGSGTPIKVLEALADGVPVVTTPWGAEGLDRLADGAVAVAAGPQALAEEVLRLMGDPEAARRQGRLGWEWVRERHALARAARAFEGILRSAAEP